MDLFTFILFVISCVSMTLGAFESKDYKTPQLFFSAIFIAVIIQQIILFSLKTFNSMRSFKKFFYSSVMIFNNTDKNSLNFIKKKAKGKTNYCNPFVEDSVNCYHEDIWTADNVHHSDNEKIDIILKCIMSREHVSLRFFKNCLFAELYMDLLGKMRSKDKNREVVLRNLLETINEGILLPFDDDYKACLLEPITSKRFLSRNDFESNLMVLTKKNHLLSVISYIKESIRLKEVINLNLLKIAVRTSSAYIESDFEREKFEIISTVKEYFRRLEILRSGQGSSETVRIQDLDLNMVEKMKKFETFKGRNFRVEALQDLLDNHEKALKELIINDFLEHFDGGIIYSEGGSLNISTARLKIEEMTTGFFELITNLDYSPYMEDLLKMLKSNYNNPSKIEVKVKEYKFLAYFDSISTLCFKVMIGGETLVSSFYREIPNNINAYEKYRECLKSCYAKLVLDNINKEELYCCFTTSALNKNKSKKWYKSNIEDYTYQHCMCWEDFINHIFWGGLFKKEKMKGVKVFEGAFKDELSKNLEEMNLNKMSALEGVFGKSNMKLMESYLGKVCRNENQRGLLLDLMLKGGFCKSLSANLKKIITNWQWKRRIVDISYFSELCGFPAYRTADIRMNPTMVSINHFNGKVIKNEGSGFMVADLNSLINKMAKSSTEVSGVQKCSLGSKNNVKKFFDEENLRFSNPIPTITYKELSSFGEIKREIINKDQYVREDGNNYVKENNKGCNFKTSDGEFYLFKSFKPNNSLHAPPIMSTNYFTNESNRGLTYKDILNKAEIKTISIKDLKKGREILAEQIKSILFNPVVNENVSKLRGMNEKNEYKISPESVMKKPLDSSSEDSGWVRIIRKRERGKKEEEKEKDDDSPLLSGSKKKRKKRRNGNNGLRKESNNSPLIHIKGNKVISIDNIFINQSVRGKVEKIKLTDKNFYKILKDENLNYSSLGKMIEKIKPAVKAVYGYKNKPLIKRAINIKFQEAGGNVKADKGNNADFKEIYGKKEKGMSKEMELELEKRKAISSNLKKEQEKKVVKSKEEVIKLIEERLDFYNFDFYKPKGKKLVVEYKNRRNGYNRFINILNYDRTKNGFFEYYLKKSGRKSEFLELVQSLKERRNEVNLDEFIESMKTKIRDVIEEDDKEKNNLENSLQKSKEEEAIGLEDNIMN